MNSRQIEISILDNPYNEACDYASLYGLSLRTVWEDNRTYAVTN